MKFLTIQVPDNNYEFFKELMEKLDVKTAPDDDIFITDSQKELVLDRIKNSKPENFMDMDTALNQIKFDEKV